MTHAREVVAVRAFFVAKAFFAFAAISCRHTGAGLFRRITATHPPLVKLDVPVGIYERVLTIFSVRYPVWILEDFVALSLETS